MRQHFLVLGASDWNHRISLCPSTDQIVVEESALAMAEDFVQTLKEPFAYVYKLHKVYRPASGKEVEEHLVASPSAHADSLKPSCVVETNYDWGNVPDVIRESKDRWLGLGEELSRSYGGTSND